MKSSFCADRTCVEVAPIDNDVVAIRDSKNLDQAHLVVSAGAWNAFLDALNAGELNLD